MVAVSLLDPDAHTRMTGCLPACLLIDQFSVQEIRSIDLWRGGEDSSAGRLTKNGNLSDAKILIKGAAWTDHLK